MAGSQVADPTLADAGEARIEWADGQMPVLRSIRERFAAAIAAGGSDVHAVRGDDAEAWAARVAAVVARGPRITLDDGADLLSALHLARPDLLDGLLGGTEETTTGLVRLRALHAEGRLACPVFAVNEAITERFNDRFGTGQSTLDGILRTTNLLLAGHTLVVLGYGWTGQGVALRADGPRASGV